MQLGTLKGVSRERKRKPHKIKFTQDFFPLKKLCDDDIFLLDTGAYMKTFRMKSTNYKILSQAKRMDTLKRWGDFLNVLEPGTEYKYTIVKRKVEEGEFKRKRLMPMQGDGMDEYRKEYNRVISLKSERAARISEEHILQINTVQRTENNARSYLNRSRRDLAKELALMGSGLESIDAKEYLNICYDYLNMNSIEFFGEIDVPRFLAARHGLNDLIVPAGKFVRHAEYIECGGMYMRALYIPPNGFAAYINDDIIFDLTEKDRHISLSVDIIPVPTEEATKIVESNAMKVEGNIDKFQQRQNERGNFSAQLPYRMRQDRAKEEEWNEDIHQRDQRVFLSLLTLVVAAESLEKLEEETKDLISIAQKNGCKLVPLTLQQTDGLVTALPFGVNRFLTDNGEKLRTLTTEGLSSFIPFTVQEINDEGGAFIGQNAVSGRSIFINRKKGMNGNCMIYGSSGAGKSMKKKEEQIYYILNSDDKMIIVDPEREYSELVESVGGQVIRLSAGSKNHINAMEMEREYGESKKNPVVSKSEFMMSLYAAISEKDKLDSKEKTIIDSAVRKTYETYIASGYSGPMPTLTDFVHALEEMHMPLASDIALSFGIFTSGSLDTFAHQTNVDMSNRIICFDTYELGDHLQPVGMLVIMDYILNTLIRNRAEKRWTWVDVDEIYLLYLYDITATFFFKLAKRIRKYAGILTGITQNIQDALNNKTGRAMMANSDFCIFLSLKEEDADAVASLLRLTDEQMEYVRDVGVGRGIIKLGSNIVPFEDEWPRDTKLFQLMTTKIEESDE